MAIDEYKRREFIKRSALGFGSRTLHLNAISAHAQSANVYMENWNKDTNLNWGLVFWSVWQNQPKISMTYPGRKIVHQASEEIADAMQLPRIWEHQKRNLILPEQGAKLIWSLEFATWSRLSSSAFPVWKRRIHTAAWPTRYDSCDQHGLQEHIDEKLLSARTTVLDQRIGEKCTDQSLGAACVKGSWKWRFRCWACEYFYSSKKEIFTISCPMNTLNW